MDRDFDDLVNFLDEIDRIGELDVPAFPRRRKIYLRDIIDPFEFFTADEFRARYRFSKDIVRNTILPLIADDLKSESNRGLPISPEKQLLVALRFYSTGSFQVVCGDLIYISQPTVCKIIARVSELLAKKCRQFIQFPQQHALQNVKVRFEAMGQRQNIPGLPNIIGAIDCTHIKINRPRGVQHSESYRNRHGWFSVNVQAVVGPNMEFYDVVARWPGSSHDSRIFRNTRLHARLTTNDLVGTLVGDGGYACTRFMLTPLLHPRNRAQENYNWAQIHTRNVVERVFGVWKRKFPCLRRGLGYKITITSNIIIACAVLHNIGIQTGDDMEAHDEGAQPPAPPVANAVGHTPEGLALRNILIEQLYA